RTPPAGEKISSPLSGSPAGARRVGWRRTTPDTLRHTESEISAMTRTLKLLAAGLTGLTLGTAPAAAQHHQPKATGGRPAPPPQQHTTPRPPAHPPARP